MSGLALPTSRTLQLVCKIDVPNSTQQQYAKQHVFGVVCGIVVELRMDTRMGLCCVLKF